MRNASPTTPSRIARFPETAVGCQGFNLGDSVQLFQDAGICPNVVAIGGGVKGLPRSPLTVRKLAYPRKMTSLRVRKS